MITKELLEFIRKEKANGRPDTETTSKLVQNGWLPSDVEEGFRAVFYPLPNAHQPSISSPLNTKPKRGRKALLFIFLLLLVGGSASAYYFRDNIKTWPVVSSFFPAQPCASVITEAINLKTGELKTFSTPCEVPKGWEAREVDTTRTTTTDLNTNPSPVSSDVALSGNTKDCGVSDTETNTCFQEQFVKCSPAVLNEINSDGKAKFTILGAAGNLCKMNFEIISSTDINQNGKSMTCDVDNKSYPFSLAYVMFGGGKNCNGSLFNSVVGKSNNSNCSLEATSSDGGKFFNLDFQTSVNAQASKIYNLKLTGYKGASTQILWSSSNSSVASVTSVSGDSANISFKSSGTTQIKAIDTAVGNDCSINLNLTLTP